MVNAAPAVAGLASVKHHSGLRPLWGFSPAHFCGCWNASHSFIATAKTLYSFHVKRNFFCPKTGGAPSMAQEICMFLGINNYLPFSHNCIKNNTVPEPPCAEKQGMVDFSEFTGGFYGY
jgi:hypothetical protein